MPGMTRSGLFALAVIGPFLLPGLRTSPGPEPRGPLQDGVTKFGPGVISTDVGESWITIDPSGALAVFGRHENAGWNRHTIWIAKRSGSGWAEPEIAPFSGRYEDRGARFSPDGRWLVFSSNRPRPGDAAARQDFDLWMVERQGEGWSEARLLAPPISSDAADIHPSMASDGSIYFSSSRPGGAGRSDVYVARMTGGAPVVERLDAPVNTTYSEPDVYVDPAQRFLIIARTDDPSGRGGDDLYLVMKTAAGWAEPKNLGASVNTTEYEYGPGMSADGRTFYFTSHRGTEANIYQVAASALGIPAGN